MNSALQLGPFVAPFSLLLMFAAVAVALYVAKRVGKSSEFDIEAKVFQTVFTGLLVARLVFVWQYWSEYRGAPLDILDVRDGGWSAVGGFLGAWFYILGLQLWRRALAKPLHAAFGAALVVWLAGTLALTVQADAAPRLPNLSVVTLEEGQVNLADFSGRPTVVNLWATWCPPCVREMPMLQRAQLDHPSVNFVFVNNGESADKVKSWLAARNLPLKNVLLDRGAQMGAVFKQPGLPTTLFFDAEGRLVSTRIGELSLATLTRDLRIVLERDAEIDR